MTAPPESVADGVEPERGIDAIEDWATGYARRHPLASLTTVGDQFVLGVRTVQLLFLDLVTGRFQWQEFVRQGAFMAGTAVLPTVLVALPIGVTLSIQFALLAGQVGATSLAGAASGLAVIRQAASLVAAVLMAAAVGSAITADLGSRTMREETDAMEVMGVSVIQRLVVPRFVAAIMIGVALTGVVCFVGFLASFLFNVYFQNGAPGSFVATFASFATTGDMIVALVKAVIFGAIVAVVSCQKGLSTKGGPTGVANSVNAAVVESILLLMVVNVAISQLYIMLFPEWGCDMTASTFVPPLLGPWVRLYRRVSKPVMRLGHMMVFFVRALTAVPIVLRHYRGEFVRLLSDIAWGNGSLVVGGGTIGVAVVLGITMGALVGIEGYNFLDLLGLGPATGIISSLVNTRELAPIAASLAFATQAGCRFTAQLGSMRIAEEIDALDSIAIRPIPYLVTTRLMAAVIAVIPLYALCLAVSYLTTQVVVFLISGGSSGSYLHYFTLMLSGQDILYSVLKAVIFVWIASTVQCYYGFYASGGPVGVGVAAGHAMRASITVVVIVNMLLTMALWTVDSGARFGG